MELIIPNWPVKNVKAFTTTRANGVSSGRYASLNLATHVDDDAGNVEKNRQRLKTHCALPSDPYWLEQTHSTDVLCLEEHPTHRHADAVVTQLPQTVCCIMTGDCIPILIAEKNGSEVAAIHAGWRGLVAGVIENTIAQMQTPAHELCAWIGPCIRVDAYEVGSEVREQFIAANAAYAAYFHHNDNAHYQADCVGVATHKLSALGINRIDDCGLCTFANAQLFFSHRRDGLTGRIATVIWRV